MCQEQSKCSFEWREFENFYNEGTSGCLRQVGILASKIGYKDHAYEFYLRTARLDLDDYNNDTEDGCHITSMAGTWMSLVKGFGGMKVLEGKLHFNPYLPTQWKSYSFRIEFRGRVIKVKVAKEKTETIRESGEPMVIILNDKEVKL